MNFSVITGFVALGGLFLTAVFAYLIPDIALAWQIMGGVTLVSLLSYFYFELGFFKSALAKKTTQFGINSVAMSVVALAIVIVVNMIAVGHDIKLDLTKNKLHSLSDQTLKVVKGLKQEIRLKVFVSPMQRQEFDSVLDKYTYQSKLLKKEYVDVDRDPLAMKRYGVKNTGTIVVESDARSSRVENLSGPDDPKVEEKITNAIIQVAKGDKRKVYFLSGHGERLLSDTGREGFSEMKESLESGRYKVEELILLGKDKVPADAEIVFSLGPKSEFMDSELKALETWTKGGGKLMVMLEAQSPSILKPFLEKFGVEWHPGKTIFEANSLQQLAGGNPLAPIVTTYTKSHEITQNAQQLSLFPIPTPVDKAANPPSGLKVDSLFQSSVRSFEVALKGDQVVVDERKDKKGPISMAAAVSGPVAGEAPKPDEKPGDEKKQRDFRIVVVGDADFASNSVRKFGINSDLFQNMVSWLAHEEDLISVRPRPTGVGQLQITAPRARIINLASIVIVPLLMFGSAIGVWWKRRHL